LNARLRASVNSLLMLLSRSAVAYSLLNTTRSCSRVRLAVLAVLGFFGAIVPASGQTARESPSELIQKAVEREIAANNTTARFMFTDRKETPHGPQTELLIETNDAMAGVVVGINDKPLTAEQRRAEDGRLARLLNNPDELRKKQKSEKEDSERVDRIMKALPAAFLYEPDGIEMGSQSAGKLGDPLVRLKFHPNPKYRPPSRVEQVLVGMQGFISIDAKQHRIARIDGTLVHEVSFGWGILGHLDKGGHFFVEQADVGQDRWEITHMDLAFSGKILLIKGLSIKSSEVFSDFRPAPPNLTFAQGVEMLKKEAAGWTEKHQ